MPLYKSDSTDTTTGQATSTALSDDEKKKITDELTGYVNSINDGKAYADVVEEYMKANNVTENPSKDNVEFKDDFSACDEVKAAYDKLQTGKASLVTVGQDTTATLYVVYKKDIKADAAKHVSENRASVLSKMKTDDFDAYLKQLVEKLEYEKSPAVDKYDPKMFFVAVQPTTAADAGSSDSDSSAAESSDTDSSAAESSNSESSAESKAE